MPHDPLATILPDADDRAPWRHAGASTSVDTQQRVFHYEHQATGRMLRLDVDGRVYGQDPEGVVRLFGRGGPLALAVALNVVYDGLDRGRPRRVVLPGLENDAQHTAQDGANVTQTAGRP